jgi:hypothetical protein
MAERTSISDEQQALNEQADALRLATERAELAEAELEKLKSSRPSKAQPARTSEMSKQPASESTKLNTIAADGDSSPDMEAQSLKDTDGIEELRKDAMMAHLLDSLDMGKDIGHYGRLIFSMVARHFIAHEEVLRYLSKDKDFSEEQALQMLRQVEARDYTPPKRERIIEWQREQTFPILPNPDDPDCGNLYRNLKFPTEIYDHIGHYQEEKVEAGEAA